MSELDSVLAALEELNYRKTFNKIVYVEPYEKQHEFLALGATARERLLMAANQVGKSYIGAFETALHLTGRYPEWWAGKRFSHAVRGWAAGPTSLLVRDVAQKLLLGEPGVVDAIGTGMIPKDDILDTSLARGVTDAIDTVQVQHWKPDGKGGWVKDGVSVLRFKSYEQGRAKFQGETLDFIWDDEEPPQDIYSEEITRTNATGGLVYTTFTPLNGMSEVVQSFMNSPTPNRRMVTMTIDDAKHISPEKKAQIIASYRPYEREARTKGVPMLGEGRIFEYTEESITEAPIPPDLVPLHWKKLWGIDFGIAENHPFAAVLILWDADNDVIHVHATVRLSNALPMQHAKAMKPIGAAVPVAWPHDGINREKLSGERVSDGYRKEGLQMLGQHATFPDGGYSTEAGVLEMQERMATGRFKVASHLVGWFEEYRMYHRKDGLIVKTQDDLLSATRIAIMAKRFAKPVALGSKANRRKQSVANDIDFDPF